MYEMANLKKVQAMKAAAPDAMAAFTAFDAAALRAGGAVTHAIG